MELPGPLTFRLLLALFANKREKRLHRKQADLANPVAPTSRLLLAHLTHNTAAYSSSSSGAIRGASAAGMGRSRSLAGRTQRRARATRGVGVPCQTRQT